MSDETKLDLNLMMEELPGAVYIAERSPQEEKSGWPSTALIETEDDDGNLLMDDPVILSVSLRQDGAGLSLRAYHIENEETKRAFHTALDVHLTYSEVEQLRDFFTLILKFKATQE
jgi:hypothetical protein